MSSLANVLDGLTTEGELYESLEDGSVRCFACGHRCLIREGKRGICQVRFNQGGKLRVPWGYVAALQSDPIEKKPFSHVMPGSNALTFGMLGCDYHCGYCFTGDTLVITDRGPISLLEAFNLGKTIRPEKEAQISFPENLKAATSSGGFQPVRGVFKHRYQGDMAVIRPHHLPAIHCTPDHRIYATVDPGVPPQLIPAREITRAHYLVIPRKYKFSSPQVIDVQGRIGSHKILFQNRNRTSASAVERGSLRVPRREDAGIPSKIKLDTGLAELLGYYCAKGTTPLEHNHPDSFALNFGFSKNETGQADRVAELIHTYFNINFKRVERRTPLAAQSSMTSLALLLKSLAGGRPNEKRVPEALFDAQREIVKSFLDAYIKGGGRRHPNGRVSSTTRSRELAYGVAWLALKCGFFASVNDRPNPDGARLPGRRVRPAPHPYAVVWYEQTQVRRRILETGEHYLVPVRAVKREKFDGDVFNMEVDQEHDYLAGLLLVSNCQNWLTSQAMRDPASDISAQYIKRMTPSQMVDHAHSTNAAVVVSSYNEPLITSEWALAIFKQAKQAGLMCAYVSNGNNTPEVMEYIRPYLDAYKVDLKCMSDKNYRKLGGVLQHTLDGIQRAREMGLWVEVVTLVIPGFNDSNEELWEAARFLAGLSLDIPWHVTAFHKDYKMTDPDNTNAQTLMRAAEIGREAGLRYVYAGNLPGLVQEYENTNCPRCSSLLVKRSGYVIREYRITGDGRCPKCSEKIPGLWPADPSRVGLNGIGHPLPVW